MIYQTQVLQLLLMLVWILLLTHLLKQMFPLQAPFYQSQSIYLDSLTLIRIVVVFAFTNDKTTLSLRGSIQSQHTNILKRESPDSTNEQQTRISSARAPRRPHSVQRLAVRHTRFQQHTFSITANSNTAKIVLFSFYLNSTMLNWNTPDSRL